MAGGSRSPGGVVLPGRLSDGPHHAGTDGERRRHRPRLPDHRRTVDADRRDGIDLNGALRSRLETAWAQSAFDDFLQDEATQIIRERLAADGYLQPVVNATIAEDGATKTLSIMVERGSQTSRTTVRVDGEDEALAGAILARLEEQGLVAQAVSIPAPLSAAAAEYLRSQGYLRARVTAGAPLFDGETAIVPLTVDAGPAFSIASIAVSRGGASCRGGAPRGRCAARTARRTTPSRLTPPGIVSSRGIDVKRSRRRR